MKYYSLLPKVKRNPAYARSTCKVEIGTEIDFVRGKTEFPCETKLFSLVYKKRELVPSSDLSKVDSLWVDYQPNQFAWPMMSEKMAAVVKEHLTGAEGVDWIVANVLFEDERRAYYIPRFAQKLDVLDLEKTDISEYGIYSFPYYSANKIINYALFQDTFASWEITNSLVVNEPLREALRKGKFTGIQFYNAEIV